jgi:4-amino-4-deoxy-L-arabinose transferase-like glycosyltransferase
MQRKTILLILGAGLALRIAWALLVPIIPQSDSNAYRTFAQMLVDCGTYGWTCDHPSAYWPPGTSLLYAGLFKLSASWYPAIIVLNLGFFIGTALLTMSLTREWFGERAAVIAGAILALWPSQIQFTTVLASEQSFTFALLAGLVFWTRARWPRWQSALCSGLALGAACLIRPTALFLPLVFALATMVETRAVLSTLGKVAMLYVALFAVLVPWAIRNTRLFGHVVLVSTNSGSNLWMGNHEGSTGEYATLPAEATEIQNEAERDKYLGDEAKKFIRRHPAHFVVAAVRRLLDTHSRESIGIAWNEAGVVGRFGAGALKPLKALSSVYWWMVLSGALAGAVVLAREKGLLGLVAAFGPLSWAYLAAVHAAVVAQDRYHFPSIPFVAALAALALDRWLVRWGAHRARRLTAR